MKKFFFLLLQILTAFGMADAINLRSLSISGSAIENGMTIPMTLLSTVGGEAGVFEVFVSINPGTYVFEGVTNRGQNISLGGDGSSLIENGAPITVTTSKTVRITVDSYNNSIRDITELSSLNVKGSIAPEGTILEYEGQGVWSGAVILDKMAAGEYLTHNIYFAFNDDESLVVKRIPGSRKVVMASQGTEGENIRLNNGSYYLTLDMNNRAYSIDSEIDPYRISVFGSSVANGQGATNFRGYAYLYGQQLEKRFEKNITPFKFYTSGVSIGGNRTIDLHNRYDDLLNDFSKYVMIGLSLGNEGIHNAENQERVFTGFRDNMLTLIEKIRSDCKIPVVVNNYTRGDYNDSDYSWVRQMNLLIHQWDVPSFNVLGAIDDGSGHWANGYIADVAHPNTSGHKEFLYSIVPSLFDALETNKPLPMRDMGQSYTLDNARMISITGEETVHSFTINLMIKGGKAGRLLNFEHGNRKQYTGIIEITPQGDIVYHSATNGDIVKAGNILGDNQWHNLTLTHYYAKGATCLYLDGISAGTVDERIILGEILIGDGDNPNVSRQISEISFWRSGMNEDEINAVCDGKMLKSSLEIYSPMNIVGDEIVNLAQSMNNAIFKDGSVSDMPVINRDYDYDKFAVIGGRGFITFNGITNEVIDVYSMDGIKVTSFRPMTDKEIIPLTPGLYVIKNRKVIVH